MARFYEYPEDQTYTVEQFLANNISSKQEYYFIKDNNILRQINKTYVEEHEGYINLPVEPTKEDFINNGYEDLLKSNISAVRSFPETKLNNVFIS